MVYVTIVAEFNSCCQHYIYERTIMLFAWIILMIVAAFFNAATLEYREGFGTWLLKMVWGGVWTLVLVAVVGWALRQVFGA